MVEVNLSVLTEAAEQKFDWGRGRAGVRGCGAADYPRVEHREFSLLLEVRECSGSMSL